MKLRKLQTKKANLESIIEFCEKHGVEPKAGHVDAKKDELREVERKIEELQRI
jgi:hypothetical protein